MGWDNLSAEIAEEFGAYSLADEVLLALEEKLAKRRAANVECMRALKFRRNGPPKANGRPRLYTPEERKARKKQQNVAHGQARRASVTPRPLQLKGSYKLSADQREFLRSSTLPAKEVARLLRVTARYVSRVRRSLCSGS